MSKKSKEISLSVNGRASICNWELEFYFLEKTQVRNFIKKLMKEKIDFNFDYWRECNNEDRLVHFVSVRGSWANNLTRISQILETVDYNMD